MKMQMVNNKDKIFIEKNALIKERIHAVIQEKRIKKKELASKMGILPNALSRMLQPHYNMTLKTICQLEQALGVEIIRCYYYN